MTPALPYRRLASFYFFHYAALGALVPYWSLYMAARGFGAMQIGQVMAIILGARVVAPTLWGWFADRGSGGRLPLRLAGACALFAFLTIPLLREFAALAVAMAIFSLGLSGVIPQFEANTLNHLGKAPERYGRVRLWGSVGFIAAVSLTGLVFEALPVTALPWVVSALLACMLAGIWLTPVCRADSVTAPGSLLSVIRQPPVAALLIACFLVQASFGPYYVFFTIYLDSLGYSSAAIGFYWALAVAAEIVVFLYAAQLFSRFALRRLFQVSVGLCVLRWALTAEFADWPALLLVIQLTHMATFGLYHAVAVSLIHRFFRGHLQVRGQGLYSSLSFGAGGVAGSVLAGFAWQHVGPALTYYLAATIAAAALLMTLISMRASMQHAGRAEIDKEI